MKAHHRLALGSVLLLGAAQTFAAGAPSIGAEVGKPLQAAQQALQQKNYAEAQKQLHAAEAVGKLTPYEQYAIASLQASAAQGARDYAGALAAYEKVLASPAAPPENRLASLDTYVRLAYAAKDTTRLGEGIAKYKAAGGNDAETLSLYGLGLYQNGKYKEAAAEVGSQVHAAEAAGKRPSDTQLQILADCAQKQNDTNAYVAALQKLVLYSPKKSYWADLIQRSAHQPGFSGKLDLDVYRLRQAVGTLDQAADYLEAAQLALQARLPGEAQKFVDEGYQRKLLGEGADAARHQRLKDLVAKQLADDKATQAEEEKAASAQAGGDALVNVGFNRALAGDAKGLELMQQGLQKGGLGAADQARLHFGYANHVFGRKDAANAAFNGVGGSDGAKSLAQLWLLQGKAPPATN